MISHLIRVTSLAAASTALAASLQAQTLLSWSASNFAAFTDPSAAAFDSDVTNPMVEQGTLTRGGSIAGTTTTNGVFGGINYSTSGDLGVAQSESSFWEFVVTPETGNALDFASLTVNVGTLNTISNDGGFAFHQGPNRLALGYSFSADPLTDNFVEIDANPDVVLRNAEGTVREIAGITATEWDLTFLQSIQTAVYFRLYLFNASDELGEAFIGSSGAGPGVGTPDLVVRGVGAVVPEPATVAVVMGLASLAAVTLGRRRKRFLVTKTSAS
ncbi:MAG: PEP-CTERM sorting domain-containing protein [Opitutales bacterium]